MTKFRNFVATSITAASLISACEAPRPSGQEARFETSMKAAGFNDGGIMPEFQDNTVRTHNIRIGSCVIANADVKLVGPTVEKVIISDPGFHEGKLDEQGGYVVGRATFSDASVFNQIRLQNNLPLC